MDTQITVSDKILHLKNIQIFEDLAVSELAAIASVTNEVTVEPRQDFIKEGQNGNVMYLVVKGEVAVIKNPQLPGGHEIELARIKAGDYFGEMALFEDAPRAATIRTVEKSWLLALPKNEFAEIVREYPQIALHICKAFGGRIRELHDKIKNYEAC
ncbi:MAG: cyclic nucleotide-binding domain-containing protein [Chloroflexi bacterium]|nr:cyclic nucleotide-binding domain-containing protein [Chloroflexota bacterium]